MLPLTIETVPWLALPMDVTGKVVPDGFVLSAIRLRGTEADTSMQATIVLGLSTCQVTYDPSLLPTCVVAPAPAEKLRR